ncbi:MAG: serine hydrolase [Bacteroidetes bacterium]|nr:serine hydrolase [Bacteroidota bacterium]
MKKLIVLIQLLFVTQIGWSQGNIQLIDQYFDSIEKYNQGMGSIAIFKNGKIQYATDYGYSSLAPKVANTKKTKYRIGSISKIFTAICIMQLVEEKKLELKENLSTFFPEIPNANQITIEHLLRHRSGLFNFTENNDYQSFMSSHRTREDHIALFIKNGTTFPPDSTFSYSNTGYTLLSYILEDIDKKPYAEIIKARITKPLKLKKTYHAVDFETRNREALSFYYSGTWLEATQTNGTITIGAGSIVSNPRELVLFFNALEKGKLVSATSFEEMKTWKNNYGLGLFHMPKSGIEAYGHTGGIDGFQSILFSMPEQNIIVAFCGNAIKLARNEIVQTSLDYFNGIKTEPVSFEELVITLSPEELAQYVGTYANEDLKMKIEVRQKGNRLEAQATSQNSFPLDAISKDTFVFDSGGIKIVFEEDQFVLYQSGATIPFKKEL